MKNLINLIDTSKPLDADEFSLKSRNFRQVLEAVSRGEEELGDVAPDNHYHFTDAESIDMDLPCDMFVSKNKFGTMPDSIFAERLRDRLGLFADDVQTDVAPPLPSTANVTQSTE